jgi:hypothetical protein
MNPMPDYLFATAAAPERLLMLDIDSAAQYWLRPEWAASLENCPSFRTPRRGQHFFFPGRDKNSRSNPEIPNSAV